MMRQALKSENARFFIWVLSAENAKKALIFSVFSVPPLRPLWLKNALFYDTRRDLQGMNGFFQINDTIIIDISLQSVTCSESQFIFG